MSKGVVQKISYGRSNKIKYKGYLFGNLIDVHTGAWSSIRPTGAAMGDPSDFFNSSKGIQP
jgi:hypothetical protein